MRLAVLTVSASTWNENINSTHKIRVSGSSLKLQATAHLSQNNRRTKREGGRSVGIARQIFFKRNSLLLQKEL